MTGAEDFVSAVYDTNMAEEEVDYDYQPLSEMPVEETQPGSRLEAETAPDTEELSGNTEERKDRQPISWEAWKAPEHESRGEDKHEKPALRNRQTSRERSGRQPHTNSEAVRRDRDPPNRRSDRPPERRESTRQTDPASRSLGMVASHQAVPRRRSPPASVRLPPHRRPQSPPMPQRMMPPRRMSPAPPLRRMSPSRRSVSPRRGNLPRRMSPGRPAARMSPPPYRGRSPPPAMRERYGPMPRMRSRSPPRPGWRSPPRRGFSPPRAMSPRMRPRSPAYYPTPRHHERDWPPGPMARPSERRPASPLRTLQEDAGPPHLKRPRLAEPVMERRLQSEWERLKEYENELLRKELALRDRERENLSGPPPNSRATNGWGQSGPPRSNRIKGDEPIPWAQGAASPAIPESWPPAQHRDRGSAWSRPPSPGRRGRGDFMYDGPPPSKALKPDAAPKRDLPFPPEKRLLDSRDHANPPHREPYPPPAGRHSADRRPEARNRQDFHPAHPTDRPIRAQPSARVPDKSSASRNEIPAEGRNARDSDRFGHPMSSRHPDRSTRRPPVERLAPVRKDSRMKAATTMEKRIGNGSTHIKSGPTTHGNAERVTERRAPVRDNKLSNAAQPSNGTDHRRDNDRGRSTEIQKRDFTQTQSRNGLAPARPMPQEKPLPAVQPPSNVRTGNAGEAGAERSGGNARPLSGSSAPAVREQEPAIVAAGLPMPPGLRPTANNVQMIAEWYYRDPQGHVQGPASLHQLRLWLTQLANQQDKTRHHIFCQTPVWREGTRQSNGIPLLQLLDSNP